MTFCSPCPRSPGQSESKAGDADANPALERFRVAGTAIVTGGAGDLGLGPLAAYNVSKAGVLALRSSMAAEWASYGIRVNSISPGYMNTVLDEGDGLGAARKSWSAQSTMGRMGEREELCGGVVLLASGAGTYITGADILVDGGQTLCR